MSYSNILFLNSVLPDYLLVEVDGETVREPSSGSFEKDDDGWWEGCFVNNLPDLPKHHYEFAVPRYDPLMRADMILNEPENYSRRLKSIRMAVACLKKIIELTGEEPLYMMLFVDYVLTDADLDNAVEVNLNGLDFTEGKEPEEFVPEWNRFYRFVCR